MLLSVCLDEIEKNLLDKKQRTANRRLARLGFWPKYKVGFVLAKFSL